MPATTAASTAEIMSWADLHGIDTHGISMVPPYDERRRCGKIDMTAEPKVVKRTPVSVLVDGGGGLGHPKARRAMSTCHREGEGSRHRRRRGAQLGAFRRLRLLCA
jgi:LDH2 family malate/lactate/ureidoglycolate dehydrogenase